MARLGKTNKGQNMIDAKAYPIDYDALEKGGTISVEELEHITGKKSSTYAFGLAVLAFSQNLQERLEERGLDCVIAQEKRGIKILTDIEASQYSSAEFNKHVRGMGRNLKRILSVDTSEFDADQRALHDARAGRMSFIYAATRKARREVRHIDVKKPDTPKLIESRLDE